MDLKENLNIRPKAETAKTTNFISTAIKIIQPSHNNSVKPSENEAQKKKLNFMDSFRPVYYISRVFGLKPFSIIYDTNGDVQQSKITKFDCLWFMISMCIYVMMVIFVEVHTESYLLMLGYIFTMIGAICSVLIIALDMCTRCEFVDILRKIMNFDKEVKKLKPIDFIHLHSSVLFFVSFRWPILECISIMKRIIDVIGCIAQYQ